MVAGIAVRSTLSAGAMDVGMSEVNVEGTVAGLDETDGRSPHALRVTVPALMPINLMKSLRVILFFEIIFFLRSSSSQCRFISSVSSYGIKRS